MIVVCGDFHGYFKRVNRFLSSKPKVSTILQCGDFGFWPRMHGKVFYDSYGHPKTFNMYTLKNRDVKIFWCDGNHEDHESLKKIENFEIMPNVFYMRRGKILPLVDGRNILFIGGAYSIDKASRTPGEDWFPEEEISQQDIYDLIDAKIDIVISHTAPLEFDVVDYHNDFHKDSSRDALSYVLNKYHPKLWYFGHMHLFKQGEFEGCKWTCLSSIESGDRWWIELEET